MKFATSTLLALLATTTSYAQQNRGCVDGPLEADADLFPNKVQVEYSEFWGIEYFGTYKIVQNKKFNLTYLLYQCGTEVPANQTDGRHEAILEIPLTDAAISATPMISFMEQLELRDQVSSFLSSKDFVASPCFLDAIEDGEILTLNRGDAETAPTLEGGPTAVATTNQTSFTTFITGFAQSTSSPPPFTGAAVAISEDEETTNNAIFEWVKFFSVFFNKEKVANEVFEKAESRLECVTENAGRVSTGSRPKLLWGYYSSFCGGWDVAECPNYYCEFAAACSADIMGSSEGSNQPAIDKCGATYMTDDEFFAHGQEADVWFFPSWEWNFTENKYGDRLNEIKAYREKKVYDYMGRGSNAWFEQRFAEYYKVVDDLCYTLGVKDSFTGRHFWRDVFTEDVPPPPTCNDQTSGSILEDPDTCVPLANTNDDPDSSASMRSVFFGIVAIAAVALAI